VGSPFRAGDGAASLLPRLEVGARHDGGDAETGFGIEFGGGLEWSDPSLGLSLDLSGRTLVAHGNDDLKDRGFSAALSFDPTPATRRGASLSLRQDFGGPAQGGLDALLRPEAPTQRTGGAAGGARWSLEGAYGLPAFGGRFTAAPHAALGLGAREREYSLGWRLAPDDSDAPDVSLGVKAARREDESARPEHSVGVEFNARW